MRTIEVKVRTPTLIKQLIEVWQNSVKETHLFLSKEEIKKTWLEDLIESAKEKVEEYMSKVDKEV